MKTTLFCFTHAGHELSQFSPDIDPNGSFEDCLEGAEREGLLSEEFLAKCPQLIQLYRMARYEAGVS